MVCTNIDFNVQPALDSHLAALRLHTPTQGYAIYLYNLSIAIDVPTEATHSLQRVTKRIINTDFSILKIPLPIARNLTMSEETASNLYQADDRSSLSSGDSDSKRSAQGSDLWAGVDRTGFPDKNDKVQPWKENDLVPTQQYRPSRWNLLGRAWDSIMVAVEEIIDLGTGKTW